MLTLIIILSLLGYGVGISVAHGYARGRWIDPKIRPDSSYLSGKDYYAPERFFFSLLWPFSLIFFGLFENTDKWSFNTFHKRAQKATEYYKTRVEQVKQTHEALKISQQELDAAQEELEKELKRASL